MAIPAEKIIDRLTQSGLFSHEEAAALRDRLGATIDPADGDALADSFVAAGEMTIYQADAIRQGRIEGLVFGEYRILDKIDQGGMGLVFKAEHRRMKRLVALKTISPEAMKSPAAVKRFYREVETAARLDHPNIVPAYDAGEHDGVHYLVMQLIDGRNLEAIAKDRGPLPVEEVVDYTIQAARGLQYAHEQGVVHRDITPRNLLLDKQGVVKILDMGLARTKELSEISEEDRLTADHQAMGSCDYMAPEQAFDAHQVDCRADIYSLGCTLFRLLTGQVIYNHSTLVKILLAHREAPIPSLREARSDVPAQLDAVFVRMVAKRPVNRFASMTEVMAALKTWRQAAPPRSGDPSRTHVKLPVYPAAPPVLKPAPPPPKGPSGSRVPAPPPAAALPEETNAIGIGLVRVPPGDFLMGSGEPAAQLAAALARWGARPEYFAEEYPQHRVRITRPFWLARTPVTLGQFRQFVQETGYQTLAERDGKGGRGWNEQRKEFEGPLPKYNWRHAGFPQDDRRPVVNVAWHDAVEFCRWLTDKERKEHRLPSEAEWEYACRAGTTTRWWCGDDPEQLAAVANVVHGVAGARSPAWKRQAIDAEEGQCFTSPVGSLGANPWGLFDMHGNVWEWCSDRFEKGYYGKSRSDDPKGPAYPGPQDLRVLRGGAWCGSPADSRSSSRIMLAADFRIYYVGFRIARSE